MTADSGYIKIWFDGPDETMAAFRTIAEQSDRQNQFSCGLSWLDDLDCSDEAESEAVSYDTISATLEFLSELLKKLPDLQFDGTLEHSWPILPYRQTLVKFSSTEGVLRWEERCEEAAPEPDFFQDMEFDEDEEVIVPLTPYD